MTSLQEVDSAYQGGCQLTGGSFGLQDSEKVQVHMTVFEESTASDMELGVSIEVAEHGHKLNDNKDLRCGAAH